MAEAQEAASSGLFGVFLLSIYSLFLIPYTIYHFCSAGEETTTQPVAKVGTLQLREQTAALILCLQCGLHSMCFVLFFSQGKKKAGFTDRLRAWCTKSESQQRCCKSCSAVRPCMSHWQLLCLGEQVLAEKHPASCNCHCARISSTPCITQRHTACTLQQLHVPDYLLLG